LGAGSGAVGEVINLPVGPGNISGHRVVAQWVIPPEYLRSELKSSELVSVIAEIIGDSMSPTYFPGDRVIIDLSQTKMTTDTVYAISDGLTEPQIKRLQRVPFSDPPQVIIISDNPNLERFTVDLERITIIGRIVGHIARK
jgi:phage repressor protein C with HTH and peptisase S24 domain